MSIPVEIAWYLLDDDAANTMVADQTGGHNATVSSDNTQDMSVYPGKVGNAFYFDGTLDRKVSTPDHADFDFAAGMTIAFWAKPDSTDMIRQCVCRYDATSGNGYFLGQSNMDNGHWMATFYLGGSSKIVLSDSAPTGGWQHVAVVREMNGTLKLYVDGTLQNNTENHPGAIDSNGPLWLGCDYQGYWRYEGKLDDVRIYADALTAEQVQLLYNNGAGTELSLMSLMGTQPKCAIGSPVFGSVVSSQ